MKKSKEPTGWAQWIFYCHAPLVLKKPWEQLKPSAKAEFTKNGPIPCEGGFAPGEWCEQCRFGGKGVQEDAEINT